MTNKIQHKQFHEQSAFVAGSGEIAIAPTGVANVHFEDAGGDMRSIGADPTAAGTYVRDVSANGAVGTWVAADATPGGGDGSGDYGFWNRNDTDDELTPRTAGDDVSTTGDMKAANFVVDQTTADVTIAAADPAAARTYTFPDEGGDRNITIDPAAPGATTQYVRQITDAGVGSWVAAVPGGDGVSGDFGFWSRDDGTDTLSPRTADDDLDMGAGDITTTGDISGVDGTFTGDVALNGAGRHLRFAGTDNGGNPRLIDIQAPTLAAGFGENYVLTLPINDGDPNQVLTTNGTGTLSWTTPAGGGGGASVTVSLTPPGSPDAGDLWFCADDQNDGGGRLYIYYSEGGIGGSNQWVDVSQPNTSTLTQAIADDRYLRLDTGTFNQTVQSTGAVTFSGRNITVSGNASPFFVGYNNGDTLIADDIYLVRAQLQSQGTSANDIYVYSNAGGTEANTTGTLYGYHSL